MSTLDLSGPDALASGLISLTASSPFDDGGCLPCQERARGVNAGYASTTDDEDNENVSETLGESDPNLVPWSGVIGVEGEMTGDGRMIAPNALRVDDLPLPLRYVSSDVGAHDGAVVVGTIENVEREAADDGRVLLPASGFIDLTTSAGPEAVRGIMSGAQPGVSMDLDSVSFEVHVAEELVNAAQSAQQGEDGTVEIPRTEDGAYIVSKVSSSDEVMVTTDGRIRAATLVAIPAFSTAKLALNDPEGAREVLTASGGLTVFNWVDDEGGLPDYIDRIRKHLEEKGMPTSHAIAVAVNVVKKACATGDVNFPGVQHENAASQAEACEAVSHWEAMKAKHSHSTLTEAYSDEDSGSDAPTVADAVVEADPSDEYECTYPDCDAPADLLVPLIEDDAEKVDDDELEDGALVASYCRPHATEILEVIGDEPLPTDDDSTDDDSLDAGTLAALGFSQFSIDRMAEQFDIVHAPPGSPIGGQFISPEGASSSSEESKTRQAQDKADNDSINQLSTLSAKALDQVMSNLQNALKGMPDGDARRELLRLIDNVTTAQGNVAQLAKEAKNGKGGKSGSSKSGGGSGSAKGGSGKTGKSKKSSAAKAAKAKAAADKKAAREKAKAEKAKERQEAKDKRDSDRVTKQIQKSAEQVAKAHAAEIKKTQTELNGYYKKFHSKITPEERGQVQHSIDTCTETLKKLQEPDYITAGAAPDAPPEEWFKSPGLTEPTPLTITPEGRVYGHLAAWNTCHTSHTAQGQCVLAPRTQTDYAYFHTGAVLTAEGTEVRAGHITMDTRHAGGTLGPAQTMSHYEDTGTVIADVACGEDAHGIWFSGALRPWATDKQVRMLRSSPLSGDWRRAGNGLELVAALAVNVPGFPVPRPKGLVASGHVQSLIAGGMLAPSAITDHVTASGDNPAEEIDSRPDIGESRRAGLPPIEDITPTVADHLTPEDLKYLKSLAARERETLKGEADTLAQEMFREQVHALARDMSL